MTTIFVGGPADGKTIDTGANTVWKVVNDRGELRHYQRERVTFTTYTKRVMRRWLLDAGFQSREFYFAPEAWTDKQALCEYLKLCPA